MRIFLALLAFFCVVRPIDASAQGIDDCVNMSASAAGGSVDPFAGSTSQVTFDLTIERPPATASNIRTQSALLFLKPGTSATTQELAALSGLQVLFDGRNILREAGVFQVRGDTQALFVNFRGNGNDDLDSRTVSLKLIFQTNSELTAGKFSFDLGYSALCKKAATGGNEKEEIFAEDNTVKITVNVRSGLRASVAGLDAVTRSINLGELGPSGPQVGNGEANISVQSSGPYSVAITSQTGWCLTPDAENCSTTPPTSQIGYKADFGDKTNVQSLSGTPFRCGRASIAGQLIRLKVTTTESGHFKAPSTKYKDELTIVLTPLAVLGDSSADNTVRC